MVQAIINVNERTNQVLNIVKAKYNLRDKSEAINVMAEKYEEILLEPELRPEYIKKAKRIIKEKAISIGSMENFRKRYEK